MHILSGSEVYFIANKKGQWLVCVRAGVRGVSKELVSSVVVKGYLEDVPTSFLIDTGSVMSLIHRELAIPQSMFVKPGLSLKTVDGSCLNYTEICELPIVLGDGESSSSLVWRKLLFLYWVLTSSVPTK